MILAALLGQAHALSCLYGPYDANVTDLTVPPDVVLMVNHTGLGPEEATFHLVDEDGAVTPLNTEVSHAHALLTPDEPLVEGRTYTLEWQEPGWLASTFTVGPEARDDEPPAVPVILEARRDRDRSEWGTTEGIDVVLEPATELGVYFELEVASTPDFTDARSFATVWPEVQLGVGLCSSTIEGYTHNTDRFVRARAVDLSGHTSDWTPSVEARQALPLVGCSTVSGRAAAWLALPLLALYRRR